MQEFPFDWEDYLLLFVMVFSIGLALLIVFVVVPAIIRPLARLVGKTNSSMVEAAPPSLLIPLCRAICLFVSGEVIVYVYLGFSNLAYAANVESPLINIASSASMLLAAVLDMTAALIVYKAVRRALKNGAISPSVLGGAK